MSLPNSNIEYTWESEVRDNETDLQGVVNNANYFIYMAHARHKHLKAIGIDFDEMHKNGINLLLTHSEIDFKASLKSGDEFVVTSLFKPNGKIRFDFEQQIIRKADKKVVAHAINTGVCLSTSTGRPVIPDILKNVLNIN